MKRASIPSFALLLALFSCLAPPPTALAQQQEEPPLTESLPKRELSEKEQKKREERLRKELERHYRKWLEEDVVYIITPEEREAFLHLNTDEEREQFIEQFWLRRDPTPDTIENEQREEHYRRIAYANERFASGIRGWESDRGRIYIMHGPPDEIESHPAGGMYDRSLAEGGGGTMVHAFERWRYRYIEGVGNNVILEFVDISGSGEYRLTMDPSEKDALTNIPGAGLSLYEQSGLASKRDRFLRGDGTQLPWTPNQQLRMQQFERMEQFAAIQKPPPVKFKDLEAMVDTRISFNLLPFEVRLDHLRITEETVLVPVTLALKKKDLAFQLEDGIQRAVVNVFGRVTTLTGRIVETFEDVIELDVPPALLERALGEQAFFQKAVPLRPGLYKLNLVLKDLNSGNVGTLEHRLAVPRFSENELSHSSLILADLIQRVSSRSVGRGQFIIGSTKVRPLVGGAFQPDDQVGIYMQVYNLGIDESTHKPYATIHYSILRDGRIVFNQIETTNELERAGQQITLEKLLALGKLEPGAYKLRITVTDWVRDQSIQPSAEFRIYD